jgi:hypothetical protein
VKKVLGFDYNVSLNQIRRYQRLPIAKKLAWLFLGNKLRKSYPQRIVDLQDKFREGKI